MSAAATPPTMSSSTLVSALATGDTPMIVSAVLAAKLLVPVSAADGRVEADGLALRDGGRFIWAFSDVEALLAVGHRPIAGAAAVAGADLLRRRDDERLVVTLNPAGPFAVTLLADVDATPTTSPLIEPHRWADPDARLDVRTRAATAFAAGRDRLAAGDPAGARAELESALAACVEIGDRLHVAAVGRRLASARERLGDVDFAVELRAASARAFDELGELALAAATRADAGGPV